MRPDAGWQEICLAEFLRKRRLYLQGKSMMQIVAAVVPRRRQLLSKRQKKFTNHNESHPRRLKFSQLKLSLSTS